MVFKVDTNDIVLEILWAVFHPIYIYIFSHLYLLLCVNLGHLIWLLHNISQYLWGPFHVSILHKWTLKFTSIFCHHKWHITGHFYIHILLHFAVFFLGMYKLRGESMSHRYTCVQDCWHSLNYFLFLLGPQLDYISHIPLHLGIAMWLSASQWVMTESNVSHFQILVHEALPCAFLPSLSQLEWQ